MKKIIYIILSLLMIISSASSFIFAEDNINNTAIKENSVKEEHTAYHLNDSKSVNGVKISVVGDFNEEGTLFINKIDHKKNMSNDNVVKAYSFDIKVLNDEGEELQPLDTVDIKFNFNDLDKNTTPVVYHEKEQIESEVKGDTVITTSDSFSTYTVEFYYEDKKFIIEGDSKIKLSELLDNLGLSGEVSSYEVSNDKLFTIINGDEHGIEYKESYDKYGNLKEYYPINKENGDTLYLISLKPFTTEEWLKVTINDIEYTIKVTDAIRVNEKGEEQDSVVKSITATGSGTSVTSGAQNSITDNRVIQGPTEDNFTASMPLAEIYINDVFVNMELWKTDKDSDDNIINGSTVIAELLVDKTQDGGKYKGFELNTDISSTSPASMGSLKSSYGGLTYNFGERFLNNAESLTVGSVEANKTNYELFPGDIVKYTLKGMATKFDPTENKYKDYDIVITYSDILLSLCNNSNANTVYASSFSNAYATLLDTNMVFPSVKNASSTFRLGMSYNVNVKVVDPDTGNLVGGSYYYPMVDVDVGRTGISGFANLYNAANFNRYSEQVALLSNYGRPTSSGSWEQKIWIPGGNWSKLPVTQFSNITDDAFPYTSKISSVTVDGQNALLVQPGNKDGSVTKPIANTRFNTTIGDAHAQSHNNSFYSGFITLANNTAGGIKVKGWGSAQGEMGMESYILTGSKIVNHKVDSSSNEGGTIFTTTTGNSDGKLSGGTLLGYDEVNKPFELSAATGQSVTYTMTPKGGYKLKKVWVKDSDIDVMSIVNTAKDSISKESFDSDNDGTLDETENANYESAVQNAISSALTAENAEEIQISDLNSLGKGVYSYTFSGITQDKSIHIEWEKTNLTIEKKLNPSTASTTDKFKFQIKLTDTSTEETTWRVRAKKNTGTFVYNTEPVEHGTPYYMSYHSGKSETLPYSYVAVTDTTDKNPESEGWYILIGGVYYATTDETPKEGVTYYMKDDTQTSSVTNFYHYILGWNESTGLWDTYTIPAPSQYTDTTLLGASNLDNELSDSYRFVSDGNFVYNKDSYNSETDSYDEYLIWVTDTDLNQKVLVVGNTETYPDGIKFTPGRNDSNYIYVYRDGPNKGKIVQSNSSICVVDNYGYGRNWSSDSFSFKEDTSSPIYYNLETNNNNYTINSGFTKLEGESGTYIVTLPAGTSLNIDALASDGWDVSVSRVGSIEDDFDLEDAMTAAGATPVAGAINTFEFELGAGETIDFNGVVPVGYNYEISEILDPHSKWKLDSQSSNAVMNNFDGDEDATFTNSEKKHNITIEKQTIDNKAGTFNFAIDIYKENIIKGQTHTITLQAYKNSEDTQTTYKINNPGTPIVVGNGFVTATIPSGDSYRSDGGPLQVIIDDLIQMTSGSTVPVSMNSLSGEISTETATSIYDQVQEALNGGNSSFSFEPVIFTLNAPDIVDKVPYNPTTLPSGVSGSNGTFTFDLSNGESKTFTDIPHGYKYEIKETGLPAKWKNVSKTHESGVLTNNVTSSWVNEEKTSFDLKVNKKTVNNESGQFNFEIKVWKEIGEAYAVFDSSDGSLTFFRDDGGKYTNNQTDGTKTYYTWIETLQTTSSSQIPWYSNRANVQSVTFQDSIKPVSTAYWFYGMNNANFKEITRLEKLDTSNVTSMSNMFYNCQNLTTLEVSHFDTSNVTDMSSMFRGCKNLTLLDVSHFDTSNVTNMERMFSTCRNLTSLDVSHFDTSNVENMGDMFAYCQNLTATLNIMNMPVSFISMCFNVATQNGAKITLKYIDPVTSANIDTLVATKSSSSNVINGGEGVFTPPDTSNVYNDSNPSPVANLSKTSFNMPNNYTPKTDSNNDGIADDGVYKFTLNNNASTTIPNIPYGYNYEVYEVDSQGNKILVGGNIGNTKWRLKSINGNSSGTITDDTEVTFNNEPLTDITVYKQWKDNNRTHTSAELLSNFALFRNNQNITSLNLSNIIITDKSNGKWEYKVNNLPKYDDNGDEYLYEVKELIVPTGYKLEYANGNSAKNGETITNIKLLDITVNKSVTGLKGDKNKDFNFSIEFKTEDDNPYNLTNIPSGVVKTADGKYSFSLKDSGSKTFEDILYGVKYSIIEDDYSSDKYTTKVDRDETREVSSTMTEDKTHNYVNDKDFADLTITKNVTGNLGNKEKEFTFTIDIFKESFGNRTNQSIEAFSTNSSTGGSINSAAWYFNDSTFTFSGAVSTQEKIDIIKAIPKGEATSYRRTVGSTNQLSTLYETGITGYRTNDGRKFDFLITDIIDNQVSLYAYLYEVNKDSLSLDDYQGISKSNNTYTFKLKDGESLIIPDIPTGYKYEIVENNYSEEGYHTYIDNNSTEGRSINGTLNSNKSHTFENNLSVTVPTKITNNVSLILIIFAIAILAVYKYRKKFKIVKIKGEII